MARLKNGILGGFSGTIGPVVGASYNGKDYMRSRADSAKRKAKKAKSPAQAKFKVASELMSSLLPVLKITCKQHNDKWTPQKYISLLMETCITGDHPNIAIDYSKLPVAKGRLPTVPGARIAQEGSQLVFTWTPNGQKGSARCFDKAVLITHKPGDLITRFEIPGATRNDGKAAFNISRWWVGVHETYIVFTDEHGKESSPGVYVGRIEIKDL